MGLSQVLVVDDEIGIRELLSEILRDEGYNVRLAENAAAARAARKESRPDLVLLDIWMPDTDGITLLKEWASSGQLTMPVVMMSGHATIDTAVEATRIGAYDFLEKPISLPKLLATVGRGLQAGTVHARTELTLAQLGKSNVAQELRRRLEQLAASRAPLLLTGEAGAGFILCARHVHPAPSPWLAPTGTDWLGENAFEPLAAAKDGTLFLDDISGLGKREQRGLQQLVGKLEKFNVRLICGATRSIAELIEQGQFDAGLFNAISGVTIRVPALREHQEDIPDIANLLLSQMVEAKQVPLRVFSVAALNAMRNLPWPGNLPALSNAVKTLAATALATEIAVTDVTRVALEFNPTTVDAQVPFDLPLDLPLRQARDAFEQHYFAHHIREARGNMSRVAERVGLERTHLYRKLKQLSIKPNRGEDPGSR
ncbi:MAG: sigma-54-dependent Fis family transcriptional regulator [Burkholderiales bacterium]|nr:sigma-54-dependent Fis family transcriptional regulator [Burkholderiales bacterium]